VDAEFGASFEDSVTIASGTLPIGSPATFRATIRMNVVTNYPPGYVGVFGFGYLVGAASANYSFPNGLYNLVPTFDLDILVEVTGQVGDVVPVVATLGARTDNRAGFYTEPGGGLANYGDLSETHIDA
jgi:hypothetical protein